ncbi:MAG: MMPL family transporter [Solirubrobacteraceae bacterium]
MTGALYRLGRLNIRHRFVVIAIWLCATVTLVAVSHGLADKTNDSASLPGTNSQLATSTLSKPFPAVANGTSPIVLHARTGKLTDSNYRQAVDQAAAAVDKQPHVAFVINPLTATGAGALSKDKTTGYLTVGLSVSPGSLSTSQVQSIVNAATRPAQAAGLEVATGGQLGQKLSQPATESSEVIGIVAAMLILTFSFGTVVAMLVPILNAIFGVLCTLAIIRMLGNLTSVPSVAPTLATMIGLGVGIDYGLFIVTRHFRGLGDGLELEESIARAVATSGGAVLFAGSTVTIALISLLVANIPQVTTMGLTAAISVLIAVLAALTLLPAVLATLGARINSLRVRPAHSDARARTGLWAKWAGEIAKRPAFSGLIALLILIPLMVPVLSLHLGQQDNAAMSESTTIRRAYDLTTKYFGPGVNGPLLIAVSLGSPAQAGSTSGYPASSSAASQDPRATDPRLVTLQKDIASTSGVVAVSPVQIDKAGTTAYFSAVPKYLPSASQTAQLVTELRANVIPKAENGTNMSAYVGGTTAGFVDLGSEISSKLPLQIVVVIVLSFLLLVLAFRTLVIPAQAALMNVLSIAASYGVLTAIFQYGWGSTAIGLPGSVPIVAYVPLFMFAILFGLSMDYEVFLVSQIEEHVHAGEPNKTAVVGGLVTSARVITAAAAIMVFVFGSFLINGNPTVKQFGVGLAVAVILDATVVRCLLVPALMTLLGKVNWYLPAWLARALPNISIEGAEYFKAIDAPATASAELEPVSP